MGNRRPRGGAWVGGGAKAPRAPVSAWSGRLPATGADWDSSRPVTPDSVCVVLGSLARRGLGTNAGRHTPASPSDPRCGLPESRLRKRWALRLVALSKSKTHSDYQPPWRRAYWTDGGHLPKASTIKYAVSSTGFSFH